MNKTRFVAGTVEIQDARWREEDFGGVTGKLSARTLYWRKTGELSARTLSERY